MFQSLIAWQSKDAMEKLFLSRRQSSDDGAVGPKVGQMFLAMALALVIGFGVVCPDDAEAGLYLGAPQIVQGEALAGDPLYDSQGWFRGIHTSGTAYVAGGGVLIDPWHVLTNAHVTYYGPDGTSYTSMSFSLSNDILNDPPNYIDVAEVFEFPGYNGVAGEGTDIALLRLVDPIFSVAPAIRYSGNDLDLIGEAFTVVGYGQPGVWPNEDPFDGVQRAGENVIESIGNSLGIDDTYFLTSFDRFGAGLPLEWRLTNTDSGGGWFNSNGELFGLSSFHDGPVTSGASRITPANEWIDSHITAVPEPSSFIMFAIGSMGLMLRRRRSRA